jgi:hypothetical protein
MPIILRILGFLAILLGVALMAYGVVMARDLMMAIAGFFVVAVSIWLFTAAAALDRIGVAVRHLAALRGIMDSGARH